MKLNDTSECTHGASESTQSQKLSKSNAYAIQPMRQLIDLQTRRVEAYAIQLMLKLMLYNEWRVEPMQSNQ